MNLLEHTPQPIAEFILTIYQFDLFDKNSDDIILQGGSLITSDSAPHERIT